jgi:hypothetical protein
VNSNMTTNATYATAARSGDEVTAFRVEENTLTCRIRNTR